MSRRSPRPPATNDYSLVEAEVRDASFRQCVSVSVVVPFRNRPDLLEALLRSLRAQDYPQPLLEIIVVDDDSTSTVSGPMVREWGGECARIFRVDGHEPYRLATLRNAGIGAAQGEVVLCLDQDIICPAYLVSAHLEWFHASASVATFGLRRFIDASEVGLPRCRTYARCAELPEIPSASNERMLGDKRSDEVRMIKGHPAPFNCFHGCNIAFLRRGALAVGGFDEAFNGAFGYEDLEFGARLWRAGAFIVYEPRALVMHQENDVIDLTYKDTWRGRNRALLFQREPELEEIRRQVRGGAPHEP